ncbi:MAG: DUF1569 domain-containing protein [Bacteroidota bacterium]
MFLEKELQKLEALFVHAKKHNSKVSEKDVGWHIDHSLKSLIAISNALEQSNPAEYRWSFNIARFFVYTAGSIPRGRGKAPEAVQSFGLIAEEALKAHLEDAKNKLKALYKLPAGSYFNHPYFGMLNVKQTRRFMIIHTRHHLKIIWDIMR